MITKTMLKDAAIQAKKQQSNVYLVNDDGLKIIIDNSMYSGEFLEKYNYDYNRNLVQVFMPDMILKYDTAYYQQGEMSLDIFLDIVNKEYEQMI